MNGRMLDKSLTCRLTTSRIDRLRERRSWREMNDGKKERLCERRPIRVGLRERRTDKSREREGWTEKMRENLAYRSKYRQECERLSAKDQVREY